MPKQPNIRVSQDVVEALIALPGAVDTAVGAAVTQDVVEVLISTPTSALVTQDVIEALIPLEGAARVSQDVVEALVALPGAVDTAVGAAVTQDVVEALISDGYARVSQDIIEALVSYDTGVTFSGDFGQAQADIKQVYRAVAQAQADIKQTYVVYAQAQAYIQTILAGYGQAQAYILGAYQQFAQAQAIILQVYLSFAQSQATIKQVYSNHAQSQAQIIHIIKVHAQAQAIILAATRQHGQALASIIATINKVGQAKARILAPNQGYGQAKASIIYRSYQFAQVQTLIIRPVFGQAQARITDAQDQNVWGQVQAYIYDPFKYGQAVALIYTLVLKDTFTRTTSAGNLGSPDVGPTYTGTYATASVNGSTGIYASGPTTSATIGTNVTKVGDFLQYIEFTAPSYGGAFYIDLGTPTGSFGYLDTTLNELGLGSGETLPVTLTDGVTYALKYMGTGNTSRIKVWALGTIEPNWMLSSSGGNSITGTQYYIYFECDLVQNVVFDNYQILSYPNITTSGQTQARVKRVTPQVANASAFIEKSAGYGQANANIQVYNTIKVGQAQAIINRSLQAGQARAFIFKPAFGQARARIKRLADQWYGQANALIILSPQNYAQAQTYMRAFDVNQYAQSIALISSAIKVNSGNAQAIIGRYILLDTATRSTSEGVLGTPNIGPSYTAIDYDPATSLLVNGTKIQFSYTAATYYYIYFENNISARNQVAWVEFSYSAVSPNLDFEFGLRYFGTRTVNASFFNEALYIGASTDYAGTGSNEQIVPMTISAGVTYVLKMALYENTAYIKMWDKSIVEPDWAGSRSVPYDDIFGAFWLYADNGGDVAGTLLIDNITVLSLDSIERVKWGQAKARIKRSNQQVYGQAQALLVAFSTYQFAQAQAFIQKAQGLGQANAQIIGIEHSLGQAIALVKDNKFGVAQVQATIKEISFALGSAQAYIKPRVATGQTNAYIKKILLTHGQAQASIDNRSRVGQAQAFISGGRYIVRYNGYQAPGYAKQESMDSEMGIVAHAAAFEDMTFSEHIGLKNKLISLTMTVWEQDYITVKNKVQEAATIMRSNRVGFAPLYIQRGDRHYDALAKKISMDANAKQSGRVIQYQISFECKPWLVNDQYTTISGASLLDTNAVFRDIYNGGWTPAIVNVTGTNITISGYTDNEQFTGYISISGAVSDLTINSENYTVIMNGNNSNDVMYTTDYTLYVGPGRTRFAVTGATECTITYRDKWYL